MFPIMFHYATLDFRFGHTVSPFGGVRKRPTETRYKLQKNRFCANNAPWYVTNEDIHQNLGINSIMKRNPPIRSEKRNAPASTTEHRGSPTLRQRQHDAKTHENKTV